MEGVLRMDRLTFEGNFCDIAQCRELPCPYDGSCTQKEVWARLKAYEDTGLEPEAIETSLRWPQSTWLISKRSTIRQSAGS